MKWETVRLAELYEVHNGLSKGRESFGTGFPFLTFSTVFNNYFIPDELDSLVQSTEKEQQDYSIKRGDVFVTRTSETSDELGMSCVALKDYPHATYNGFTKRMRPVGDRVVPEYIGYYMRMPSFRNQFQAFSTMTTRASLKNEDLLSLEINLPDIAKQKKIAGILMAYDSLIESKQKQIKLLEEAAQRLYKEWFIDFRFPGHESTPIHDGIPEGWEKTSLDEVIEFNPKYVLPKEGEKRVFPMAALSTSSMILDWSQSELSSSTSGTKFSNGDTLLARITPCLENGKTAFVDGLLDGEVATGSTEFIVMQSKLISPYMVYLLARSSDFRETAINSMTGSDGRQRAQVDKLKQYPYLRPSQLIIDQFGTFAAPIFMHIHGLNKQNSDLQEARNRLLPKLMSGEISL